MQWISVVIVMLVCVSAGAVAAQDAPGALCVETFADLNLNGQRDPGEGYLPGVNVNLATGNAIIATHVTAQGETGYCFENLLRGTYTVTFTDAPTYRSTTPHTGTFNIEAERLTVNAFGAYPVPPDQLRAEVAARYGTPDDSGLDTTTRVLLATAGSALVMMFMIGVGAVILGLVGRRSRSVPPPSHIMPPPR